MEELGGQTFSVALPDGRQLTASLVEDRDLGPSRGAGGPAGDPALTPDPLQLAATGSAGPAATGPARAPTPPPPARPTGPAAASGRGGGPNLFEAPMPGVVLSIEIAPGAPVQRGQTLLVLEAMKMKNELKAPRDAIVADVLVAAGQQVKHGDPLIKFE
ncbi:MAG: hypothetical protein LBJ44_06250 [Propionibacteriaceae bacterium]|nr:hypothetical protein [Propionibacteriaceae bacterium]